MPTGMRSRVVQGCFGEIIYSIFYSLEPGPLVASPCRSASRTTSTCGTLELCPFELGPLVASCCRIPLSHPLVASPCRIPLAQRLAHDIYLWNGRSALPLTKAVALTKARRMRLEHTAYRNPTYSYIYTAIYLDVSHLSILSIYISHR